MSGFHDLVGQAQPALVGGGIDAPATEGATWEWTFVDVLDNDGVSIDLTAVAGTCEVTTRTGGAVVTLDFTGGLGEFVISKAAAATAGLADGLSSRQCRWELRLVDGADVVQVWNAYNSDFKIVGV